MFSALGAIMNNCHDPESFIQALNHFYDEFSNEKRFLEYFSRNWMQDQKYRKNVLNLLQNSLFLEYGEFHNCIHLLQICGKKVIEISVMVTKRQTMPLKVIIAF